MKYRILTSVFLGTLCLMANAQKIDFALNFDYYFDNREYDRGGEAYAESMTLFASRLTPYIGLRFDADRNDIHRIMAGIDIYKEMGDRRKNKALFDEMSLYYEYQRGGKKNGVFQLVAGVFPRSYSEGTYSRVIFSDAALFTDHNIEGLLLKSERKNFYGELYCDWMGKFGYDSRERFQINSAGEARLLPLLSLGWNGSLYHYSCSVLEHYVVDNALANIYAKIDLSEILCLRQFYIKTGLLTGYQRDRRQKISTVPIASENILAIGICNFGVENSFVYAPDMMLYYDDFGSELYFGSPYYHSGSRKAKPYDRLELFWSKKFGKVLSLKLSAVAHFASGSLGSRLAYQGMQQRFTLNFEFGQLR